MLVDLMNYTPCASSYQKIAGGDAVVSTISIPTDCVLMVAQAEGDGTRYRCDGANPTDTSGVPLLAGISEPFMGAQMRGAAFWLDTGSSLHLHYYKRNR